MTSPGEAPTRLPTKRARAEHPADETVRTVMCCPAGRPDEISRVSSKRGAPSECQAYLMGRAMVRRWPCQSRGGVLPGPASVTPQSSRIEAPRPAWRAETASVTSGRMAAMSEPDLRSSRWSQLREHVGNRRRRNGPLLKSMRAAPTVLAPPKRWFNNGVSRANHCCPDIATPIYVSLAATALWGAT